MHPPKTNQPHHNQPTTKRLMLALLLSLAARFLLGSLARDGYGWQAHDLAMHFNSCLLIVFIAAIIWHRDKYSKYLACAWLGFELISMVESFFTLFKMPRIDNLAGWQLFASCIFCTWAYIESRQGSDGEL